MKHTDNIPVKNLRVISIINFLIGSEVLNILVKFLNACFEQRNSYQKHDHLVPVSKFVNDIEINFDLRHEDINRERNFVLINYSINNDMMFAMNDNDYFVKPDNIFMICSHFAVTKNNLIRNKKFLNV